MEEMIFSLFDHLKKKCFNSFDFKTQKMINKDVQTNAKFCKGIYFHNHNLGIRGLVDL